MYKLIFALALLQLLVGCGRVEEPPAVELFGTRWVVQEIDAQVITHAAGQRVAFIQFLQPEGRIHGFSGCNLFNGNFERKGDRFTFGPMMTTMMACVDDDRIELEYLRALDAADTFIVEGHQLIGYQGGRQLLVFAPEAP